METVIAFLAGVAAGCLCTRLKKQPTKQQKKPPESREQQRLWHEYQNFLNYTGEEQEEFEG